MGDLDVKEGGCTSLQVGHKIVDDLSDILGTDSVFELPRVLRVPNTDSNKTGGAVVLVVCHADVGRPLATTTSSSQLLMTRNSTTN